MPTTAPSSRVYALVGSRVEFVLTPEQSGGKLAAITVDLVPLDPGPPPHTHTREDETFYVLDGPVVFSDNGVERELQTGQCFFGPRNRMHKFRNPQDKPAKLLCLFEPVDDGFYGYIPVVCDAGKPNGPPSESHIKCVLENGPKFGIHFHL